jgi:hypothetical protein
VRLSVHRSAYVAGVALAAALALYAAPARAGEPYVHDGFQFRGAVGFGYLDTSTSDNSSIHGIDGSFELYFGGMPVRGLAIGGFLSDANAPGPGVTLGNVTASDNSSSLNLFTIGPYIDWYPHAHEGFHILGTLGYANVRFSVDEGNGSASNSSGGVTIGGGIGYDWWVARDWSIGILGRMTFAHTSQTVAGGSVVVVNGTNVATGDVTVSQDTIAPEILFSFSFN